MSRFEAYAEKIENDPRIPKATREAVAASLRKVVIEQEARDAEMTVETIALLGKAGRYLMLADRLYSTEPKAMLAILLAVCDLENKKPEGAPPGSPLAGT